MDYDDDGILDFISGSYDPGDVYLFRGLGKGKYAAAEQLRDKNGVPIVHHPEELAEYQRMREKGDHKSREATNKRVASFGSWVTPVDWENDGDLDLLIGSFAGKMFLRVNEGSRSEPAYSSESVPVHAGGKPLDEVCHANPVVADWDADGLWDLVVSSGDGSVGWYQNVGTADKPKFGARNLLVEAKSEHKFLQQILASDEEPQPGVRAQICVVDYDHDGHLDLVLGDYSSVRRLKKLNKRKRAAYEKADAKLQDAAAALRGVDEESSKGKKLHAKWEDAKKKVDSFFEDSKGQRVSHVWLYRRDPQVAPKRVGKR